MIFAKNCPDFPPPQENPSDVKTYWKIDSLGKQ